MTEAGNMVPGRPTTVMRFALSTAIHPAWDLPAVATVARSLGYAGVDVVLPAAAGGDPAAGSAVAERELVRLAFGQAGAELAGLSAALPFVADAGRDAAAADAVRRVVDLAARLKCGRVRIPGAAVRAGSDRDAALVRLADWLAPLADHAGRAGVELLVQNATAFRTARDLWRLAEQLRHPWLGVAWDPLASALAGEAAGVAVPTLGTRIRHVLLRDATVAGTGVGRRVEAFRRLGEGDLSPAKLLDRLAGIGYGGWVVVHYPPGAGLGAPEEVLAAALGWFKAREAAKPGAGAKPARGLRDRKQ